jgi:hemolysin III
MYIGERFNSITHLVGVFLAVSAVSVLMTLVAQTGDLWKIVSCAIFGAATIFLYAFSTLYHSLKGRSKDFFQKLDYVAIYVMIAGTYTPFTLVTLRPTEGYWVFPMIWGLAIFGIAQELLRKPSPKRKLSLTLYLVMGWLVTSVVQTLYRELSTVSLFTLVLGGIFYTAGVIFFVNDHKWKHAHGIWHLFVLAGSSSHFVSVFAEMI